MSTTFKIKKDVRPEWTATVKDSAGAAVDLSSYDSVKFTMRDQDGTEVIDEATASFVNKPNGTVTYPWAAVDVDTIGKYYAFFTLFKGTGESAIRRLSSPSTYFIIEIYE